MIHDKDEERFYVKVNYISPIGRDCEEITTRMREHEANMMASHLQNIKTSRITLCVKNVEVIELKKVI